MALDKPSTESSFQIILEGENPVLRKRLRNRTRASCLNCYSSKRKCDKKRPCSRCVRLGTTGLCIYKASETTLRSESHSGEINQLRNRIAELESTIHELRIKLHHRDTAPEEVEHNIDISVSHQKPEPNPEAGSGRLSSSTITDLVGVTTKTEETVQRTPEDFRSGFLGDFAPHASSGLAAPAVPFSVVCGEMTAAPTESVLREGLTCTAPPISPMAMSTTSTSDSSRGDSPATGPLCGTNTTLISGFPYRSPSLPPAQCIKGITDTQAAPALRPQGSILAAGPNTLDVCNCLKAQWAFAPLVHLGFALRTSREALQHLHPNLTKCILFSRITVLEKHIFSVSPHDHGVSAAEVDYEHDRPCLALMTSPTKNSLRPPTPPTRSHSMPGPAPAHLTIYPHHPPGRKNPKHFPDHQTPRFEGHFDELQ